MKLMKSIQMMGLFTVMALIYIHMQMQIFDVAYQGKRNQKELEMLANHNDVVAYNIMTLTSSFHLGGQLLGSNSDLKFRAQDNVIEVATTKSMGGEGTALSEDAPSKANLLLGFLSLRSEAEAKSTEDSRFDASPRR